MAVVYTGSQVKLGKLTRGTLSILTRKNIFVLIKTLCFALEIETIYSQALVH